MPPNDTSPDPSATPALAAHAATEGGLRELVVCSLESWDEVWRRNQFFVDALLKRNQGLRVLFIEPPADVLYDLRCRRIPALPRIRRLSQDGRLRALRTFKPLPRKLGRLADQILLSQVRLAARAVGFRHPMLWINDVTYVPLISHTGWPSLYDVTDDWLLAPAPPRELARLRCLDDCPLAPAPPRELARLRCLDDLALTQADEVVVCSPALAASRGARRAVSLVPNGVDVEHFRRPRPRPSDLPKSPTAVYVGSLHDARIDVDLVTELAIAEPSLRIVLIGPNSLGHRSLRLLEAFPNVAMLGARPYLDVPGYLQHADVVIVPHLVSPFTDSLDPIKVYECLAIETPTVATPVAGFRDHSSSLNVVASDAFVSRVRDVLSNPNSPSPGAEPVDWMQRARAFETCLLRAAARGRVADPASAG